MSYQELKRIEQSIADSYAGKRYFKVIPQSQFNTKCQTTIHVLATLGLKVVAYEDGIFRKMSHKRRKSFK